MRNLRPDIAGKLRNCDVWIGGQKKTFVSKSVIKSELDQVCESINKSIADPEFFSDNDKGCELHHVDFEHIHPFEDGNGRVGRILWQIQRIMLNLPIKIIHTGLEQMEYYKWFQF